MRISAPSYGGLKEVHYLFVDGGCLRAHISNISDKFFQSKVLVFDFSAFLRYGYTKNFYYDALPLRELGESECEYDARVRPQRNLLDSAAGTDRVHVYEGDARRRRKRGLEQKKVDVMIAVDMLMHTFRRNMHEATLLSGDNDFKPLIDALVHEGMFVSLWYPPGETAKKLCDAADTRQPLTMKDLHSILTPRSQKDFAIPTMIIGLPAKNRAYA